LYQLLQEVFDRPWKAPNAGPITPDDVLRMVREEGALLIFDGLDEKLVHLDEGQARAFIRELWSALPAHIFRNEPSKTSGRKKTGKLLFSCRSHYFKTIRDQCAMLRGEDRDEVLAADYRACVLLPFNEEQVQQYLGKVLGNERVEPALKLFSAVHNLKELSRRPYLLSLITQQIGSLEQMCAHGERVDGVAVYKSIVDDWLSRDDGKHYLRKEDKLRLMEDLAAAMWRDGSREWEWTKVRDWLVHRMVNDVVFKATYLGDGAQLALVEEDFRTATFVLRPDMNESCFCFAHTSLQEYFLANHLLRALRHGDFGQWELPLPTWETLEFLGQLLAREERSDAVISLGNLLESYRGGATEAAFRYWLLAIQRHLPEPTPQVVDLHRADLRNWIIAGHSPDQRLKLHGANLQEAKLWDTRWRHVDLSAANVSGASFVRAQLECVIATDLRACDADFTSARWHRCAVSLLKADSAKWVNTVWIRSEVSNLPSNFPDIGVLSRCRIGPHSGEVSAPDIKQQRTRLWLDKGHDHINACAWSPDGERLLSAAGDTLKTWDSRTGACSLTFQGHSNCIWACSWSPDGTRVVSAASDETLKVWDAETGACVMTIKGDPNWAMACVWSPDGRQIASASLGSVLKVWDVKSGANTMSLRGHGDSLSACAWSPNGQHLVSGSWDKTLRIWDAQSGVCLIVLQGHTGNVCTCGWSPDGQRIVSGSADSTVKVWDANTGACVLTLKGHCHRISACSWSPDKRRIVSASYDGTARVWDAESGECLHILQDHGTVVSDCVWSPNGERLLSSSWDATMKIWDPATGQALITLVTGPRGETAALDFANNTIVSASDEAWRILGWMFDDKRLFPADHFGPIGKGSELKSY